MIKTCARCGNVFEAHWRAKYCVPCRYEIHKEHARRYWHTTEKYLRVERVRRCKVCGKEFEAKTCAKYCPDCREDVYKKIARECARRLYEARRGDKPVKPKLSPQGRRLVWLRKQIAQAKTPETRKKYFREYVLLRQKLSREREATS